MRLEILFIDFKTTFDPINNVTAKNVRTNNTTKSYRINGSGKEAWLEIRTSAAKMLFRTNRGLRQSDALPAMFCKWQWNR